MIAGRPARAAALCAYFLLLPDAVLAQEAQSPPEPVARSELVEALREARDEKIERYIVRQLTQKRLSAAIELLDASDYAGARARLEKLNFPRLNPYERALAYRFLAYAAIGQEDSEAAIRYFEKAVEQEALPIDAEAAVRFNVAQLYAALQQWEKVETTLAEWFDYVVEPNPVAYYMLAISYYQRERFEDALPHALKAVALAEAPAERWLQLVVALYLQADDFDAAVPILEELVTRFPKKRYWVQLSIIYGARGDYEHALRVQQLAYVQGLLTEDEELQRLARSYLFHDLPFPAAEVLERGLEEGRIEPDVEVLELLGNAWIAAREYDRALEPLQQAASLSEDGRLYLRLGQVRMQREDWDEAAALIEHALSKGGLEDAGKAELLLGICHYSADRPGRALDAFMRARRHESIRKEASAWLKHLERQGLEG